MWWHTSVSSAFGKVEQENKEFKAILSYQVLGHPRLQETLYKQSNTSLGYTLRMFPRTKCSKCLLKQIMLSFRTIILLWSTHNLLCKDLKMHYRAGQWWLTALERQRPAWFTKSSRIAWATQRNLGWGIHYTYKKKIPMI